jgi:hypothetical protein
VAAGPCTIPPITPFAGGRRAVHTGAGPKAVAVAVGAAVGVGASGPVAIEG